MFLEAGCQLCQGNFIGNKLVLCDLRQGEPQDLQHINAEIHPVHNRSNKKLEMTQLCFQYGFPCHYFSKIYSSIKDITFQELYESHLEEEIVENITSDFKQFVKDKRLQISKRLYLR